MAFWQKKENRFYSKLISHTHTKKKEKKREKLKLIVCFHLFIRQLPERKPRATAILDTAASTRTGQAKGSLGIFPGDKTGASLVAQMVKNLPATWETRLRFLGWEDPLEKGMATHSSPLGCRSPWTEEPGRLQSMGLQRATITPF